MSATGTSFSRMYRLEFHDGDGWRQQFELFETEDELRYTLDEIRYRAEEEYDEESSYGWRPYSYRYWEVTPDNVETWTHPKNHNGNSYGVNFK